MDITPDMVELVLKRLERMPSHLEIHLGNKESLDKTSLLNHIKNQDSIGEHFVEMEMAYLRALKAGI